jgi:hypothetical protein
VHDDTPTDKFMVSIDVPQAIWARYLVFSVGGAAVEYVSPLQKGQHESYHVPLYAYSDVQPESSALQYAT